MSRSTWSITWCITSGSICCANAEESATSPNRTVTCLRSPSRALREVRIFSARCLGVYDDGEATLAAGAGGCARLWPHALQKRLPGGFTWLHPGHTASSWAPQALQNRAPTGFACWHCGQCIVSLLHVGVSPFTLSRHSPLFSYSPTARVVTKTQDG